ncbi:MAG: carbohydrate ABC transporter permease [Lachnospiraceae bacterium]|jgi:multiple sugar transport system permease protein|nr:carbohydrate ABC transporter permease [Lachnospiraceae bacterium]
MRAKKRKQNAGSVILAIVSLLLAAIMLLPIVWAFFCSIQNESKQFASIWDWFKPPYTLINYPNVMAGTSVFTWFGNSLLVSVVGTVLTVILSTLAAYAIAKMQFPGKKAVYFYFMLGLMVPAEATIVPLFIEVNNMHLINTYAGLILPGVANAMMLVIAVSFFQGLPDALFEAVRLDGGGDVTIYAKIVLPLSKPIISTIALMTFLGCWNNYLWPLLCVFDDSMFTLPIGIPTLMSIERPNYVIPMTANMIASIPAIILYLVFERQIVQGISMEGIKE